METEGHSQREWRPINWLLLPSNVVFVLRFSVPASLSWRTLDRYILLLLINLDHACATGIPPLLHASSSMHADRSSISDASQLPESANIYPIAPRRVQCMIRLGSVFWVTWKPQLHTCIIKNMAKLYSVLSRDVPRSIFLLSTGYRN